MKYQRLFFVALAVGLLLVPPGNSARAAGTTYYISSSEGSDDNDGLSTLTPFETVAKVNALDLQPGDQVRFKCGDVWRAEPLILDDSGAAAEPITFGSYPEGCANAVSVISLNHLSQARQWYRRRWPQYEDVRHSICCAPQATQYTPSGRRISRQAARSRFSGAYQLNCRCR